VKDQIKYLCAKIPNNEWSGALFYDVKGSIKDPENFSIELKEIFPMDIGSGAHTEYSPDEELATFMMDNPEFLPKPDGTGMKMGHIHSHNTMGVFFSAEDDSELNDNSSNHNYYLSVVTNNKLEFAIKIAFRGKVSVSGSDENGEPYIMQSNDEVMFVYKGVAYNTLPVVNSTFRSRIAFLTEEAKRKEEKRRIEMDSRFKARDYSADNKKYQGKHFQPELPLDSKTPYHHPLRIHEIPIDQQLVDDVPESTALVDEQFVIRLLCLNKGYERYATIGEVLQEIEKTYEIYDYIMKYSTEIVDIYFSLYREIYGEAMTIEQMIEDMDETMMLLEDYIESFQWVDFITDSLQQLAYRFEDSLMSNNINEEEHGKR